MRATSRTVGNHDAMVATADMEMYEAMAATSMAVEMLKLLLLLLLLLLLEDVKSCWDSESRESTFTGASGFVCE